MWVELWGLESDDFWRVDEEGKVVLVLEWRAYVSSRVMEVVGECVVYWLGRWWPRRKQIYG